MQISRLIAFAISGALCMVPLNTAPDNNASQASSHPRFTYTPYHETYETLEQVNNKLYKTREKFYKHYSLEALRVAPASQGVEAKVEITKEVAYEIGLVFFGADNHHEKAVYDSGRDYYIFEDDSAGIAIGKEDGRILYCWLS